MHYECDATMTQLEQNRQAQACRQRLMTPPNAVQDRPLSLKRPSRGITGTEAKELAQAAAARADEAKKQAALDRQLRLGEQIAAEIARIASAPERDWLIITDATPNNKRANSYPPEFLQHIKQVVAKQFMVTPVDIDANRRTRNVVIPRHVAWHLSRVLTPKSLPDIGRAYGGRDHTSILNGDRKTIIHMRADAQLCQAVVKLQARLQADLERWRAQG